MSKKLLPLIAVALLCSRPAFADGPIYGSSGGPGGLYVDYGSRVLSGSKFVWGAGSPAVQVQSTSSAKLSAWAFNGGTAAIDVGGSGGTAIGSHGITTGTLGQFNFYNDDGTQALLGAQISAALTAVGSAGSMPSKLIFSTLPAGTTATVIGMQLDQNGSLIVNASGAIPGYYGSVFPTFNVTGISTASSAIGVHRSSADASGPSILLGKSRGATNVSHGAVQAGDSVGSVIFQGDDGTGLYQAASINGVAISSSSSGIVPGGLNFMTANTAGTLIGALSINSSQNIGIGSTIPRAVLDITQSTNAVALPSGTTGTRPTGINGMLRYNSTTPAVEAYINNTWASLGTSGGGTGTVTTVSVATANGFSGTVANATTTPTITIVAGAITPTSVNGLTISTSTGTLAIANSKVATINNTLTLAGTDSTTMTFPSTSATIARTDAANTFTGTQTIGALVATTFNGNTFTAGSGTLTLGAGKTHVVNNSITLAGTDGTTMTFPNTSDTVVTLGSTQTLTNKTLTSPTMTAPVLGTATATKVTIGSGSTSAVGVGFNANTGIYSASTSEVDVSAGGVQSFGCLNSGCFNVGTLTLYSLNSVTLDGSAGNGSWVLPIGTTGTRPASPVNGMIRYSTTNNALEAYANNQWRTINTTP